MTCPPRSALWHLASPPLAGHPPQLAAAHTHADHRRLASTPLLHPLLALAEKVMRLKQAKSEAEAEIADYKMKREAQFSTFSKEVSRTRRIAAQHRPTASLPPFPLRFVETHQLSRLVSRLVSRLCHSAWAPRLATRRSSPPRPSLSSRPSRTTSARTRPRSSRCSSSRSPRLRELEKVELESAFAFGEGDSGGLFALESTAAA